MEYKQLSDPIESNTCANIQIFSLETQLDDSSISLDEKTKVNSSSPWRMSVHAMGMSFFKGCTLIILGFFFVLTTSLLVTGFQGLYPVLIEEGVYSHLCPKNDTLEELENAKPIVCNEQKLRLNLMLTVAVALLNVFCFPVGFLIDRIGPKWVGLGGSISTTIGSLLFAFSSKNFDAYIPGYILIGVGGSTIFMSILHFLNLFPLKRGFLVSLFTAAEDASTGVFFFFKLFHSIGVSIRTLFLSYSAIPLLHLIVVYMQPQKPVKSEQYENEPGKEYYPISSLTLGKQLKSFVFWSIVFWNCVVCVTSYFYISTLNNQMIWLFGDLQLAQRGSEIFSLMFIIFPFAAVPLTGWILNRFGTWPSLIFVNAQFLLFAVFCCIPVWGLQYVTFALFVVWRASYIAVSAHLVNLMFGENFSTLIGVVWTIGGLSSLSNHLWVYIALKVLEGKFLMMNLIINGIAFTCTSGLALLVFKQLSTQQPVDHIPLENISSIDEGVPLYDTGIIKIDSV